MERTNAGYNIIETVRTGIRSEIVIGRRPTAPAPFVVWNCLDGDNYYTGGYCQTYRQALLILAERIRDTYDYLPLDV